MTLLCTVRNCHEALAREPRRVICPRGHSFDVARRGYINLLQPQDRRSKQPGDTARAVAARGRLHNRGITAPLLEAITSLADIARDDVVFDAGCGDGFYLGSVVDATGCVGHGIDISISAIEAAARRYPRSQWIVANADRFMPYAGATFRRGFSITARMNSSEFRRVLTHDGLLLVALPSPDDLVELRGVGRDRVARTIETFAKEFAPVGHRRVSTRADLDRDAVHDVLLSIYRPRAIEKVEGLRLTFSLDLILFAAH